MSYHSNTYHFETKFKMLSMLTDNVYFAKSNENSKSYKDLKITSLSRQFQLSFGNQTPFKMSGESISFTLD